MVEAKAFDSEVFVAFAAFLPKSRSEIYSVGGVLSELLKQNIRCSVGR